MTAGSAALRENESMFVRLVDQTNRALARGDLATAAVMAQIAAHYACRQHPGAFASYALEQVLLSIGRRALPNPASPGRGRRVPGDVLHVITQVARIGGHTRTVWHWISLDSTRRHSVVLTRQRNEYIPPRLIQAVRDSGGSLTVLDVESDDILRRAQQLRTLACEADQVVLHSHSSDVVPIIALAEPHGRPPTILLNKSDHEFWLGVGVSDVVAHMRDSGRMLAERRRGVDPARGGLLPIPLTLQPRSLSRPVAKAAIGVGETQTLLLTIASAYKYVPIERPAFVEAVLPLLMRNPDAVLIAIGPRNAGEWESAMAVTGGRLRALGPRDDTSVFYQAADVYLDSFPFTSNTSLLEAANYEVPLVSFSHSRSDDELVLAAGAPGLGDHVLRPADPPAYEAAVQTLLDRPELRADLGGRARAAIAASHTGAPWLDCLERTYALAAAVPPISAVPDTPLPEGFTALDESLRALLHHDGAVYLGAIIEEHTRQLSLPRRWRVLLALRRFDPSVSRELFLPNWLAARLAPWIASLRSWSWSRMSRHRENVTSTQ
jgi:hypothetical protein